MTESDFTTQCIDYITTQFLKKRRQNNYRTLRECCLNLMNYISKVNTNRIKSLYMELILLDKYEIDLL